jgi:hypothetical protein
LRIWFTFAPLREFHSARVEFTQRRRAKLKAPETLYRALHQMPQVLNRIESVTHAEQSIREILKPHSEWFLTRNGGAPLAILRDEFDFSAAHGHLIFSSWTEHGAQTWRISEWDWNDERLLLEATRGMGREAAKLELIPCASARAVIASIAAARQMRCEKLAQLVAQALVCDFGSGDHRPESVPPPAAKIERAILSPGMRRDQPGRYARIILRLPHERVAVTATVAQSDARNADSLYSSALLWFTRLQSTPRRPPLQRLLMIVEHDVLEAARARHVLLRESLRQRIELLEIDEGWQRIEPVRSFERKHIWKRKLARFPPVSEPAPSERALEIIARAPHAIDVVSSRHGQTLRFHGLPFARVRRLMEQERVWFGIEGSRRRAVHEHNQRDWEKLLSDLANYRHENCRDRRHWFYRAAGEAWLESTLRRDVSKLDPGLIIAPLHAQFRTSHGGGFPVGGARPIDLLALRHDGRLAVIELKVNEDREHVFQGVDYWRRVEAHRRRGHISDAKLFGDREISDESPLVYLVAPALRFHPSFGTLAKTIAPDIEIYRFDINEDWRSGVRVVRRECVNG